MTAAEKQDLAAFLDIAEDYVRDGFRTQRAPRAFSDDSGAAADSRGERAAPFVAAEGDSLARVAKEVNACARCPLAAARTKAVPGEGSEHPLVMVIGEGPGADEDASGRPFVGKAGQLLATGCSPR